MANPADAVNDNVNYLINQSVDRKKALAQDPRPLSYYTRKIKQNINF